MNVPIEFAEKIYKHAEANYNEDGWDVLVECWDVKEIQKELEEYFEREIRDVTYENSLNHFSWLVSLWLERKREVESTIW